MTTRMNNERKQWKITGFVALVVFTVFAVCILLVLLTGADVYRQLTQREQQSYDKRTAAQYITMRVRQADKSGCISVEDFCGVESLVMRDEIDGEFYETRVYCFDGYIKELFSPADSGLLPQDGENILRASSLSFDINGSLLTADVTTEGETQRVLLYLRSAEGGV